MLNLKDPDLPAWPAALKPIGEGKFDQEPFDAWWARHGHALSHLHPQIAEQWIHRHWTYSHFSFLPLDELASREESWDSGTIVRDVMRYGHDGCDYTPDFDYRTFQRRGEADRHATAVALDAGTWDYPIVVLETPNGFIDARRPRPDARFVLIEGHQRMRYLNALHTRGHTPLGPHRIFVLTWTDGVGRKRAETS
ncbi:MAG: hypothetical protein R3C25_11740 [Hyphomonadaceae bacterium]